MATYKTLVLDVETIQGASLAGATVYVSYDRTVRLSSGGIIPDPASAGIATPVTGTASVQVIASDDPDLAADSVGFGINVRLVWTEAQGDWQRKSKSYTAQVHMADDPMTYLSGHLATTTASNVTVLQGPPGPTPAVAWTGDQVTVSGSNGSFTGPHLTGPIGPIGPIGLPGVNAVDNDAAVAGYVGATSATQAALDERYPHAEIDLDGSGVTQLTDGNGNPSWVDFAFDGSPASASRAAVVQIVGTVAATTQPTLATGQQALWFQLDPTTGDVIDILTGKG